MAANISKEHLTQLEDFITYCKSCPEVLHLPELSFFKKYLLSLGAIIPDPPTPQQNESPKEESKESDEDEVKEPEMEEEPKEESSEESEVELDNSGVVEPDNDEPLPFGDDELEVTDEMLEESSAKRGQAQEALSEGRLEDAVNLFTEAIKLNPCVASLYGKRAAVLLKMEKPNAVIRDCDKALGMNPDLASAYKFRGRAHRLLGHYEEAVKDLATACRIDYTDEANEWLKEATPNANKIADHRRKYERKRLEKEERERAARRQKILEERERAAREARERESADDDFPGGFPGGFGGGIPGGLEGLQSMLQDPEILEAFQDPEVSMAFQDVSKNPANMAKYQSNPKVANVFNKIMQKLGGKMPGGCPI